MVLSMVETTCYLFHVQPHDLAPGNAIIPFRLVLTEPRMFYVPAVNDKPINRDDHYGGGWVIGHVLAFSPTNRRAYQQVLAHPQRHGAEPRTHPSPAFTPHIVQAEGFRTVAGGSFVHPHWLSECDLAGCAAAARLSGARGAVDLGSVRCGASHQYRHRPHLVSASRCRGPHGGTAAACGWIGKRCREWSRTRRRRCSAHTA